MSGPWDCPKCEVDNFSTHYQCPRCSEPRPRNGDQTGDRGCSYGSPNSYRGDASECDDESRCESDEKAGRCERTRSGDKLDSTDSDVKEHKIGCIMEMQMWARDEVVAALAKSEWNTEQATNWLIARDSNDDEKDTQLREAPQRRQQPPFVEQKCGALDATEETDLSRHLAVFGLSQTTTERDVREAFESFGQITKICLIVDAKTQISKGFAFIDFVNGEDAAKAKEATTGMKIDHRPIRVLIQRAVAEVGEEVPELVFNEQNRIAYFAIKLTELLVTHKKQFKQETVQTRLVWVTQWYLELTEKMSKIEEFKGMFADGWWSSVEQWSGYLRRRMKKLIDVHPCAVCKVHLL